MSKNTTRRDFIKQTALAAGAAAGAIHFAAPNVMAKPADDKKLRVAAVAVGGMGGYAFGASLGENLVAIVEIDDNTIADALKTVPRPPRRQARAQGLSRLSQDARRGAQGAGRGADSTPDHHHAPAAIRAIEPRQCRSSPEAAGPQYRRVPEAGRGGQEAQGAHADGQPGALRRRLSPAGRVHLGRGHRQRDRDAHDLQSGFRRLGRHPARKARPGASTGTSGSGRRPTASTTTACIRSRGGAGGKFGTGTLGDMACHCMDGVFWALRLREVKAYAIECLSQQGGSEEMFPQSNVLQVRVPGPRRACRP